MFYDIPNDEQVERASRALHTWLGGSEFQWLASPRLRDELRGAARAALAPVVGPAMVWTWQQAVACGQYCTPQGITGRTGSSQEPVHHSPTQKESA